MTPAEKEAYANCRTKEIHLATLEVNDLSFTEPLRVVSDNDDLHAELEDGSNATFVPMGFELVRPPVNEEPDPSITTRLDNTSAALTPYLELASQSGNQTTMTFRPYLYREEEQTATLIGQPLTLDVRNARADFANISITAAHVNPANIEFPKEVFGADRFPGL